MCSCLVVKMVFKSTMPFLPGHFCVELACSLRVCVRCLRLLQLLPIQRHAVSRVRLTDDPKFSVAIGCLFFCVSPVTDWRLCRVYPANCPMAAEIGSTHCDLDLGKRKGMDARTFGCSLENVTYHWHPSFQPCVQSGWLHYIIKSWQKHLYHLFSFVTCKETTQWNHLIL